MECEIELKTKLAVIIVYFCIAVLPQNAHCFKVLLDPGHSYKDSGALSCGGINEFAYNIQLAIVIKNLLINNNIDTVMTCDLTNEPTLPARAKAAKNYDILISIHHDSVQPQFTYKNTHTNGICSDKAKGFSIFVSSKNRYFNESTTFAYMVGHSLRNKNLTPSTHHSEPLKGEAKRLIYHYEGVYLYDDLIILKYSESPSILLEAAVIVNPADELNASSADFQKKIAESILDAVRYYISFKGK